MYSNYKVKKTDWINEETLIPIDKTEDLYHITLMEKQDKTREMKTFSFFGQITNFENNDDKQIGKIYPSKIHK